MQQTFKRMRLEILILKPMMAQETTISVEAFQGNFVTALVQDKISCFNHASSKQQNFATIARARSNNDVTL